MSKKEYVGTAITIGWEPEKCQHAARCVGGSPAVFHPGERPWITPDAEDAAATAATIDRCPSRALTYVLH